MDALMDFEVIRPTTVDGILEAKKEDPEAHLLGGGTDLIVNIRRGIGEHKTLIDITDVEEIRSIKATADEIRVGAGVKLVELASDPQVNKHYPVIAQAAGSIAGPTHRQMGTVGGNVCLDTRCVYYNQSEWWRTSNDYCLKHKGEICHVAPKSDGVCFATFSGDLAPAFLLFDGELELAGPKGKRTVAMKDFYIGYSKQDGSTGDGKDYMALEPGEFVVAVKAKNTKGLVSAYDKIRVRRSIDYPLAGVAVALKRSDDNISDLRVAFTGTNPRPVLLEGTEELEGKTLDDELLDKLDDLGRDQLMAMKTTFTPGHYRRRVAIVMAKRLVKRLFEEAKA